MDKYMKLAIQRGKNGGMNNEGGPFGALIVDKNGHVVSIANNQVNKEMDPTAHAEIQAIRAATKKLGTNSLKGYKLYSNCEPCPMCMSAIILSNIQDVYFGADKNIVEEAGFRNKEIYEYFKGNVNLELKLHVTDEKECQKMIKEYKE